MSHYRRRLLNGNPTAYSKKFAEALNELKKYGDVVLNISTREKLYSKIGGFVNENSIKLILDILYACYFDKDYEGNLNKRIHISKESETTRFASLDIMKESEP